MWHKKKTEKVRLEMNGVRVRSEDEDSVGIIRSMLSSN